ncbi:MAG: ubiquinol-cytochrome c reductase iron-sulfur subunit [Janthinobacterium lividum]
MDDKLPPPSPAEQEERLHEEKVTRRTFMMNVGIALNAIVGLAIATPVVAYLVGPVTRRKEYRHWIQVGNTADFQPGETRLINYRNPFTESWDGETADIPAYVRAVEGGQFVVFAINCAHLGCPVRWFSESQLFMCPCHGGVYYADGSRASGPPERGLFTYDVKTEGGRLMIDAGQMPTLSNKASASPCPGSLGPQPSGAASASNLVTRISPCPGTNEPTIG